MKKYRVFVLLFIFCCALFTGLTFKSFQKLNKMASVLAADRLPTIVLDAGHGGEDGGASSKSGLLEKDINLAVALNLQKMLEAAGFPVVMIRDSDIAVGDQSLDTVKERKSSDIRHRLKVMEDQGDCIFLSIHQNHFSDSKYYGAQIFYSPSDPKSADLAESIRSEIVTMMQPENKRESKAASNSIYLLWHAKVPAVIVECGFLSNDAEAQKLGDPNYQRQMAFSIYQGFMKYWSN